MIYKDGYWEDVALVVEQIPNVDKIKDTSILVTGATGMICSAVTEILFWLNTNRDANIRIYLAGRNKQRMMERFPDFLEGKDYQFVQYDATQESNIDVDIDYIIHGASNADPVSYASQPVETILGNIIGLNQLLALTVKKNAKRLLYVSSSEVYGRKDSSDPYKEEDYGFVDILNPRACYPNAKRTAETLCVSYAKEYDVDVTMVRPGHIYGPTTTSSDSRASAQFARNAFHKEDIVMKSAGAQLRSYCYTLDCASAILAVLLNGENKVAYNISNKNSVVSIREVAEMFAECSGAKVVFENPSDAEKSGYNLMDNSALEAGKLEALGWNACFDLEEGVKRTLKYF